VVCRHLKLLLRSSFHDYFHFTATATLCICITSSSNYLSVLAVNTIHEKVTVYNRTTTAKSQN